MLNRIALRKRGQTGEKFECHVREGLDEEKREDWRKACEGPRKYIHNQERYCVLHYPGEDKKDDFERVRDNKLNKKDYNFTGTVFPEGTADFRGFEFDADVDFSGAKFSGSRTDFFGAQFSSEISFIATEFSGDRTYFATAQFSGEATWFLRAKFNGETYFTEAQFSGKGEAHFDQALFSGEATDFARAKFNCGLKASFLGAQFSGKTADFSGTQFSGGASFEFATFNNQPNFSKSALRNATFEGTIFKRGADFTEAKFTGTPERSTDFRRATFEGEVYFKEVTFSGDGKFNGYTDFYRTSFLDAVKFIGGVRSNGREVRPVFHPEGQVSFTRARIDKPELFSFDTVDLRPSWLVGVDARKFDFTAVKWYGLNDDVNGSFNDEIRRVQQKESMEENVEDKEVKEEHSLAYVRLEQACQRLAANAEENRDYPTANEFHYWSMEAQRKNKFHGFVPWRLSWWYWLLSGYSERPLRAFCALGIICLGFALLYVQMGLLPQQSSSDSSYWTTFGHALLYSFGVITRQKVIPEPDVGWEQFGVFLEGILGPVQLGLVALGLRRIFMR